MAKSLSYTGEPSGIAALHPSVPPNRPSHAQDVTRRAAKAGKALLIRQALVYGANIAGSLILARLVPPSEFGFYGIVLFALTFLNLFGGTGFAANLIRAHEEPTLDDKRVVFTAQQAMVGTVFVVLWLAAPYLASLYHMPASDQWFFRMIGGSLVITSFMVMPQIQMERELAFDRLAVVEVSQAIAFNASAVLLAWRGWGAMSFAAALMLRSAVGALLAYWQSPWQMGLAWDPPVLRRHLHFGIALQAGQFVGILKDSISPLFVGIFLGAAEVGYVTWATSLTAYAVWILMPMQRLYLPFFARLQHDRPQLQRALRFALWMSNLIAAPLTIGTLVLSKPITILIFGPRWLSALPLYFLFCVGNLFIPSSTPLLGVLNALGESRKTLAVSVMWMATTWILGVPAILLFGLKGFGVAMIGVQLTNLVLYRMVWRELSVSTLPAYWPSWPLAGAIGLVLYALQLALPILSIPVLVGYAAAGALIYGSILWIAYPGEIRRIIGLVRSPA